MAIIECQLPHPQGNEVSIAPFFYENLRIAKNEIKLDLLQMPQKYLGK